MDYLDILMLFSIGALGGALNAVAGGGKFLTFPVLILAGLSPAQANVTSSVALWPGSMASAAAYRREWMQQKELLPYLIVVSLIGSGIGAWILLNSPERQFEAMVPWLLLAATLLFTFGASLMRRLAPTVVDQADAKKRFAPLVMQFFIGIYGGYFGAGIGILMLAMLQLVGLTNIHRMNALKMVLGCSVHATAVIYFILQDVVVWDVGLVLILGAVSGGYGGAALAQKCPPQPVRWLVSMIGFAMTLYFFIK